MNYIILAATEVVTNTNIKHRQARLIFSSFIGSIYAVVVYIKIFKIYESLVAKVILSIIMVYIAFKPGSAKDFAKKLIIFYMTSFVFGGCTIALMYIAKPENVKLRNGVFVGTYPIKIAVVAGIIAFIIIEVAFRMNKAKITTKDMICKMQIIFEGKIVETKAFIDTGNLLKEPITGAPVVIVEEKVMKEILPTRLLQYMKNNLGGDDERKIQEYKNKIRAIPFMSLGKENGMLIGIKVDKIIISGYIEEKIIKNVIVGIYNKKLSKNYNALIGLNLLEKENEQDDEPITNF